MKRFVSVLSIALVFSAWPVVSAQAGTLCNNGTYSSNSGRGTCSYNGGINKSFPSYSDPGSSSYNRNNGLSGSTSRNNGLYGSNNDLYSSPLRSNGLSGSTSRNNGLYGSNNDLYSSPLRSNGLSGSTSRNNGLYGSNNNGLYGSSGSCLSIWC